MRLMYAVPMIGMLLLLGSVDLYGFTDKEVRDVRERGITLQLEYFALAKNIDSAQYPLRNAFLAGAGIDRLEKVSNPYLGQGKFWVRSDGFGFLPIICYQKVGQCVVLQKDVKVITP